MRAFSVAMAFGLMSTAAMSDWANPELETRNLSKAQWNAIARGDFAECDADAKIKARQASAAPPRCSEFMDPAVFQQCKRLNSSRTAGQEQMFEDLLYGCMARRGWSFAPD